MREKRRKEKSVGEQQCGVGREVCCTKVRLSKNRTGQRASVFSPIFILHFMELHGKRAGNPIFSCQTEELNWLNLFGDSFVWFLWKPAKKNLVTRKSQAVHPKEYDDYHLSLAKNTTVQLSGVDESSLKLQLQKYTAELSSTRSRHPTLPMMK